MASNNVLGWGIKTLILVLVCVLAFSIRLFSVVKYESVIHEFDPYFNYRVSVFLTKKGFYEMWNWFDDRTWYPLGRIIGGTVYPGLIFTAGTMYKILHALNIPINIQEVCVFTAPLFSALCSLAAYGLVSEAKSEGAGLIAAALMAMVPSYISRSVAGSYDNEGVAIFALVNVFYLFVKTLNTGSLAWAVGLLMGYLYMVMSWGGYSFIINLLPIYALTCILSGRMHARLYVAFTPLVVIGTLLAASIPVIGFNAVLMSEHFAAFLVCGILHGALLLRWIRQLLPPKQFENAVALLLTSGAAALAVALAGVIGFVIRHPTFGWTGRSLSLLDPTYASKYIPIIASVSEHQPPSWPSYLTDLHVLVLLVPLGVIACFRKLTDGALFLVLYVVTAVYFSGVMVRLMLVLAPATCCLAAVGLSDVLSYLSASVKAWWQSLDGSGEGEGGSAALERELTPEPPPAPGGRKSAERRVSAEGSVGKRKKSFKEGVKQYPVHPGVAAFAIFIVFVMLCMYTVHCVYVSADMYSAPSVVLQSARGDGSVHVFDDFREAYAWLRHNTHPEAKVASWWDYGYQTTAMANRTIIVDNNTWNNTHIATVGRAMSSGEAKAWRIYRQLDVDYVFVVFGGLVGYPSDDINKFLWMVRIGGGVFPDIKEPDYLTPQGEYKVDSAGSSTMLKSLMYKLSYYDFAEETQHTTGQRGFDRVRGHPIGKMDVSLKYFEEVFTSQHWMMRIYRVRDRPNREKASKPRKKRT